MISARKLSFLLKYVVYESDVLKTALEKVKRIKIMAPDVIAHANSLLRDSGLEVQSLASVTGRNPTSAHIHNLGGRVGCEASTSAIIAIERLRTDWE